MKPVAKACAAVLLVLALGSAAYPAFNYEFIQDSTGKVAAVLEFPTDPQVADVNPSHFDVYAFHLTPDAVGLPSIPPNVNYPVILDPFGGPVYDDGDGTLQSRSFSFFMGVGTSIAVTIDVGFQMIDNGSEAIHGQWERASNPVPESSAITQWCLAGLSCLGLAWFHRRSTL